MMKWIKGFIVLILAAVLFPTAGFAISDSELADFLAKEKLTKEQVENHIQTHWADWSLDDFETAEELEEFLGDRINDENLAEVLAYYDLASEEELAELVISRGDMDEDQDVREYFLYIDAVDAYLEYNTGTPVTDEALEELADYYGLTLEEIETIFIDNEDSIEGYEFIEDIAEMLEVYGVPLNEINIQILLDSYGLTLEQVEQILADNDDSLDHYYGVDMWELENALLDYGLPITEESLSEFLESIGYTLEEVNALFAKYNDSIDQYDNLDDLYTAIMIYVVVEESGGEIEGLGIGLTKQEAVNLAKHFITLDVMTEEFQWELENIANRIDKLGDFESANDLTPAQMQELTNIYIDILNLFELNAKYYLVKGNEKTAISQEEVLALTDTKGADLLIELYNLNGGFLADMLLTAELFGSDLLDGISDQIDEVEDVVSTPAPPTPDAGDKPGSGTGSGTVKGGKLPNTSGNYGEGILAGMALMLAGAFLIRMRKVVK